METLTVQIPSDPASYFLEFDSKEEYLSKRDEWKALYKWLSVAIRHNKQVRKTTIKTRVKIENRMAKRGWVMLPGYIAASRTEEYKAGFDQFNERLKSASRDIPARINTEWLDATHLLEIRAEMKEQSKAQREQSLLVAA